MGPVRRQIVECIFDEIDSESAKSSDCGTIYQLPVQSDETTNEAEEEEEPDCE